MESPTNITTASPMSGSRLLASGRSSRPTTAFPINTDEKSSPPKSSRGAPAAKYVILSEVVVRRRRTTTQSKDPYPRCWHRRREEFPFGIRASETPLLAHHHLHYQRCRHR